MKITHSLMFLFNLTIICFEENNCMINGGESNKGKVIEPSSVGTENEIGGSIEKSGDHTKMGT